MTTCQFSSIKVVNALKKMQNIPPTVPSQWRRLEFELETDWTRKFRLFPLQKKTSFFALYFYILIIINSSWSALRWVVVHRLRSQTCHFHRTTVSLTFIFDISFWYFADVPNLRLEFVCSSVAIVDLAFVVLQLETDPTWFHQQTTRQLLLFPSNNTLLMCLFMWNTGHHRLNFYYFHSATGSLFWNAKANVL